MSVLQVLRRLTPMIEQGKNRIMASSVNSTKLVMQTRSEASVSVTPQSCLHDEPVVIKAFGLQPGQPVTLKATITDVRGAEFVSYAHYKANSNGQVDVEQTESLGGSYTGVFKMGLIATLKPGPEVMPHTRFFKRDVENPMQVNLTLHDGHKTIEELYSENCMEPVSQMLHERHYMGPGVQRIPVKQGRIRGTLFLPPGPGPFPGVVDMFGTAGGLLEYRSAQLASRGIASLALAFFGYDDLPINLDEFDIEYFEEAVDFLMNQEKVLPGGVGAVGVSKGAELVLAMIAYISKVKAVIAINGPIIITHSNLKTPEGTIKGVAMTKEMEGIKVFDDGTAMCRDMDILANPLDYPESVAPFRNGKAAILFQSSVDDLHFKSTYFFDTAHRLLRDANYKYPVIHKAYDGAGHILEPPFSPHCSKSFMPTFKMIFNWGGNIYTHSQRQEEAWDDLINFIKEHVPGKLSSSL